MRMNRHIHNNTRHGEIIINQVPVESEAGIVHVVVDVSDSESEEEGRVENLSRHTLRRRRLTRIAGKEPQYMGLFCSLDGEEDILCRRCITCCTA